MHEMAKTFPFTVEMLDKKEFDKKKKITKHYRWKYIKTFRIENTERKFKNTETTFISVLYHRYTQNLVFQGINTV